jgi:hypothetical protein
MQEPEEVLAMSKANINNNNDTDVLRASDIIPPFNKKNRPEQKPLSKEQKSHNLKHKAKHTDTISTEHENGVPQKAGIPKFDLAKQIMSEQRKVVSIKRISPDKKHMAANHKGKAHSIGHAVKPLPMLIYQEQIIAEIVQRDIQELKRR